MPLTPLELVCLALLGLAAGTLGGLLGVGGALLVVPVLVLFFTFDGRPIDMQLAIPAAMIMNAAVGGMASYRHWRVGTMQPFVVRWLAPAAVTGVVFGVFWGNTFVDDSAKSLLKQTFGVFALYVAVYNFRQFLRGFRAARRPESGSWPALEPEEQRPALVPMLLVGLPAGLLAGLLGIGGGGVTVPFQQIILRVPLKNAIGNSALVVFAASSIGAALKLATAGDLMPPGYGLTAPLWLAGGLVPTSMLGAYWGSYLTRILPPHWVVAPFVILMLLMGSRMVLGG